MENNNRFKLKTIIINNRQVSLIEDYLEDTTININTLINKTIPLIKIKTNLNKSKIVIIKTK